MEQESLWIERLSTAVGLDRAPDGYGPHLLVAIVWVIDHLVSAVIGTEGVTPVVVALAVLELAGLLLVASTAVKLATGYRSVANEVGGHESLPAIEDPDLDFTERLFRLFDAVWIRTVGNTQADWKIQPAPKRLRRFLYACGLGLHATYLFGLGNVDSVIATFGPVYGPISFFVIIPFLYYPILAEFVAVVVTVNVGLPSRIRTERLLNFEDPIGYAGLAPVGTLVETAGRRYVAGLVLYTLLTVGRGYRMGALSGTQSVVYVDLLYLLVGTLVGLVLFSYPLFALHSFTTLRKEYCLGEIANRVSDVDADGRFFPEAKSSELETKATYMQEFINLNVVRDTHEYPVTGWQVTNVLTGFVLPYLIEYVITIVF